MQKIRPRVLKGSLNTLALKLGAQSGSFAKNLGQGRLPAFQLGFVLSDVYHSNAWERKNKWIIDIFMNITMEVLYNSKIQISINYAKSGYHDGGEAKNGRWFYLIFLFSQDRGKESEMRDKKIQIRPKREPNEEWIYQQSLCSKSLVTMDKEHGLVLDHM